MIEIWEYKAIEMFTTWPPSIEGDFNKLGAEGWELVMSYNRNSSSEVAIFKRLKDYKP